MADPTLELGAVADPSGSTPDSLLWRVWAPHARRVELVRFPAGGGESTIELAPEPSGYFRHRDHDVPEGTRYAYRLDGGPARPDPASRWQPDGIHRPSAVFYPDRWAWSDSGWRGVPRGELVIYELHVGTFTAGGTFDAILPRLDALRELGVTALELMPVAQFPGARGWGYDGVHPFAVQNTYGGPHALQGLVDACHRRGLAVLLDVVYNHLGPEGNYFAEFGPYFTPRHRTPWGPAVNFDDRGADGVRAMVLDNVRYWIRAYHLDGLRLDSVHALYDASPRHILSEIVRVAQEESARGGRAVHVIAESSLNDARILDPPEQGGYGLDAQWSDDFHYSVHALLTGECQGHYADFGRPEQLEKAIDRTFVLDGGYSIYRGRRHGAPIARQTGDRFVISIQHHDHVGNRARSDRLGSLLTPPQQRLAAGLLLLAPYLPLLFMGEEYGETAPFPFFASFLEPALGDAVRRGRQAEFAAHGWDRPIPDPQAEETFRLAKLAWSWPEATARAGLRRLYADLLARRRTWPPLRDFAHRSARLIEGGRVLRLVRGDGHPARSLTAYFNLGDRPAPLPSAARPAGTSLLRSEAARYTAAPHAASDPAVLLAYEFQVFGPSDWRTA